VQYLKIEGQWYVNDVTVIAFYPGGGGNRYLRMLQNEEFATPGITYDKKFIDQKLKYRYLLDDKLDGIPDKYCLTHCLNFNRIKQVIDPARIIFLNTDFEKSLKREWIHDGVRLYVSTESQTDKILFTYSSIKDTSWPNITSIEEYNCLPTAYKKETEQQLANNNVSVELDSAWASIVWHHEYYNNVYPATLDKFENAQESEFYTVMNTELNSYSNSLFDFCWEVYKTLGKTAPIVDLYNQYTEKDLVNE